MSYDISLSAELGNGPIPVGSLDWNYTYNIQPMTKRAGLPSLHDLDGMNAGEAAQALRSMREVMASDPEGYRALNPENGWGDYDGFMRALSELICGLLEAPAATVRVR